MGTSRLFLINMLKKTFLFLLIFGVAFQPVVFALPEGEQVVAGSASFDRPNTDTLNVSTSDKVVINYNSFSIGGSQAVNFMQPSSSSVALNRVVGGSISEIFGALNANGHIFLINPNGVLFAPGCSVNVGSIIASALNITNEDFLGGRYRFAQGPGNPSFVVNQGTINAGWRQLHIRRTAQHRLDVAQARALRQGFEHAHHFRLHIHRKHAPLRAHGCRQAAGNFRRRKAFHSKDDGRHAPGGPGRVGDAIEA